MAYASEPPDYVGLTEGDEYIWKNTFDKDAAEDMLKDFNNIDMYEEDELDNLDVEGIKVIIDKIEDDEDEIGDTSIEGVEMKVTTYRSDDLADDSAWEEDKDADESTIVEPDDEIYAFFIMFSSIYPGKNLFIANDVDWEDVVDELKDIDEYNDIDDIDADLENRRLSVQVEWEEGYYTPEQEGDSELILEYNDKGVLTYCEHIYDGDQIRLLELQGLIPGYNVPIFLGVSSIFVMGIAYLYYLRRRAL